MSAELGRAGDVAAELQAAAEPVELAAAGGLGLGQKVERAQPRRLLTLRPVHLSPEPAGDRHLATAKRQLTSHEQELAADRVRHVVAGGAGASGSSSPCCASRCSILLVTLLSSNAGPILAPTIAAGAGIEKGSGGNFRARNRATARPPAAPGPARSQREVAQRGPAPVLFRSGQPDRGHA